MALNQEIHQYSQQLDHSDQLICDRLSDIIDDQLTGATSKIWHAHPVWFIDGNPIVGYGKLKNCIRLLFWSGQSFEEPDLIPEGKFKAAEIRFTDSLQIDEAKLIEWLKKAELIQWDYKNIVKKKGQLDRLL